MIDTKAKLQPISDEAWIVQRGDKRIGLLNKNVQDRFTFISGKTIEVFDNEDEVGNHFGNISIFEEQIEKTGDELNEFYIKGHLVDYSNPIPVESDDTRYMDNIPLYLKTEGSDVLYAAGWYCINFEKGWKQGHGPKLNTLLHYGYEGPFKTRMECKQRMRLLNKEKNG